MSWQDRDKIHDFVNNCKDVESLMTKLMDVFGTKMPESEKEEVGIDAQSPTFGATNFRGFKAAPQKVEAAHAALHEALVKRGCDSVAKLARRLAVPQDAEQRGISYEELKAVLFDCGCALSDADLQALFRFNDPDCTGAADAATLLASVRPELPPARAALVQAAFDAMDAAGDGALTVAEVSRRLDCSVHPDVRAAIQSEDAVLESFLAGFDGTLGPKSSIVTPEKFAAYYANASAAIDDDDFFALVLANVWRLPAAAATRRLLVTHDDGTVAVEELEGGVEVSREDLQEMRARLREGGVPVAKIALYELFDGADGVATSPVKRPSPAAAPAAADDEPKPVIGVYKERMLASSVTF